MVKEDNLNVYVDMAKPMIDFYDKNIIKNKNALSALEWYKLSDYKTINQLLLGKPSFTFSLTDAIHDIQDEANDVKISADVIKKQVLKDFRYDFKRIVKTIKALDKVLDIAPFTTDTVIVYRGLTEDIHDDMFCKDNVFHWVSKNYMSTSFNKDVSRQFSGKGCCFMTLTLPPKTKGIFLPWLYTTKSTTKSMKNADIDNEYEFLLPRGCTFVIDAIEYDKMTNYKYTSKYKNIPCDKNHPMVMKHYKMRLVKQLSLSELKGQYRTLFTDFTLKLETWDIAEVKVNKNTYRKQASENDKKKHKTSST